MQTGNQPVIPASLDVYAFGCTMLQLLQAPQPPEEKGKSEVLKKLEEEEEEGLLPPGKHCLLWLERSPCTGCV